MSLADGIRFLVLPLLGAALIPAALRLLKGPTLADRVVALDLMAVIAIAFGSAQAVATGRSLYLDVAVFLALLAFLGTVAFALYVQRSAAP